MLSTISGLRISSRFSRIRSNLACADASILKHRRLTVELKGNEYCTSTVALDKDIKLGCNNKRN
jgi:hypothetical protein